MIHRIISPVSISESRRHSTVADLLKQVNTRLTTHKWSEDDTRISNLGFHVNVDPSNFLSEEFEESVRQTIRSKTNKPLNNIPRFQCVYTSPFVFREDGTRISTKSYDIQCRQQDAKEMLELLKTTYKDDPSFIFHRLRHDSLKLYINAIRKQNAYLSQSRVVPVHGITEDVMFYLENEILQINGVIAVLKHKDTLKSGRWNVSTNENNFKSVSSELNKGIYSETCKCHKENELEINQNFPQPGLAFRNKQSDDISEDKSFASYLSACNTMYSLDNEAFDEAPLSSRPVTQGWDNPVPLSVMTASTPATPSTMGHSHAVQHELTTVKQENNLLKRQIAELTKQVQILANKPLSISPEAMNQIVTAATQAVMQANNNYVQNTPPVEEGNDNNNLHMSDGSDPTNNPT